MRTRRPGGYLVAAAAVCAFVQLAAACGGPARPVAHPAPAVSQRRAGPPSSTPAMRSSALPPGAPGSARPRSARLPRTDWAVPGSVIRNLDTAPGSPYRPGEKVVALTFDDGPSAVYTPQILRILVAARASASFEIIGVHGGAYPRILRAENATGMALVNHTWTHIGLAPLAAWRWPAEVDRTSKLLRDVTGHPVRCLRPPYGRSD